MRQLIVFSFLFLLSTVGRLFYRYESEWHGDVPEDPWHAYRLVAVLNHTSLYEFLFAGIVPVRFLWRMANHATIPIADVTMNRPIVGIFWRFVAGNVVSISRERDQTWAEVLDSVDDPESMLIILPEGRMKRVDGLDKSGKPMSVRGGIADILRNTPEGNFLVAYSQGLHHIQVPGQHFPNLFRKVRMRFESIDIASYRTAMEEAAQNRPSKSFRKQVIEDLTKRRDRYCTSDRGGTDRPQEWSNKPNPA